MECFHASPAPEEIDTTGKQAAGGGAGQQKTNAPLLDQRLHFVEQHRKFLDFIDDNDRVLRKKLFAETARPLAEAEENVRMEQVVAAAVGECLADERGFAGLPRAEQKSGLLGQQAAKFKRATDSSHDKCRHLRRLS